MEDSFRDTNDRLLINDDLIIMELSFFFLPKVKTLKVGPHEGTWDRSRKLVVVLMMLLDDEAPVMLERQVWCR